MHRQYHRWYSPALGRDMELLQFGHAGARTLVFPTSMGRFYEWEDRGMIAALREHLERGWLQLWCVDSIDAESWYAKWKHPHDRARRNEQYNAYLIDEVLPLTRHVNGNPFCITTGTSFGAFHALAFALRFPHLVGRALGMSGMYDIKRQTDGYSDDAVYFANPADFVRNEWDGARLDAIRRVNLILAIGRDDPNIDDNRAFAATLAEKGIPCAFHLWDGWVHDWPWWREMVRLYIGG